MKIREGNLEFDFIDEVVATKFDENNYYRKRFNNLHESKAVDFLAYKDKLMMFLEVKDFKGHEIENVKRLRVNRKDGEDGLDYELAKKVAMTLACLFGAAAFDEETLSPFYKKLSEKTKANGKDVKIKIILFLEGEFKDTARTFKTITDSLKKQLSWFPLDTKILVENIKGHNRYDVFKVARCKRT